MSSFLILSDLNTKHFSTVLEVAYQTAVAGLSPVVISPEIKDPCALSKRRSNYNVHALERIQLKYFETVSEIINWCHEVHTLKRKPNVILLNGLHCYTDPQDFKSVHLCSALIDAASYCQAHNRLGNCNLLVTVGLTETETLPISYYLFNEALKLDKSLELIGKLIEHEPGTKAIVALDEF